MTKLRRLLYRLQSKAYELYYILRGYRNYTVYFIGYKVVPLEKDCPPGWHGSGCYDVPYFTYVRVMCECVTRGQDNAVKAALREIGDSRVFSSCECYDWKMLGVTSDRDVLFGDPDDVLLSKSEEYYDPEDGDGLYSDNRLYENASLADINDYAWEMV